MCTSSSAKTAVTSMPVTTMSGFQRQRDPTISSLLPRMGASRTVGAGRYVAKVSLWVPRFPKQAFNPDKRLNFQADAPYQIF